MKNRKSVKFKPSRDYVRRSVEYFLNHGGVIQKVEVQKKDLDLSGISGAFFNDDDL